MFSLIGSIRPRQYPVSWVHTTTACVSCERRHEQYQNGSFSSSWTSCYLSSVERGFSQGQSTGIPSNSRTHTTARSKRRRKRWRIGKIGSLSGAKVAPRATVAMNISATYQRCTPPIPFDEAGETLGITAQGVHPTEASDARSSQLGRCSAHGEEDAFVSLKISAPS